MDHSSFDRFVRAAGSGSSRRAVVLGLTTAAGATLLGQLRLGLSAGAAAKDASAERKKKQKKRKKKASVSPPPPPPPGPTCTGTLISGRCALACGNACLSRNGVCANRFQDLSQVICFPKTKNACVDYPDVCTQDAGCGPAELCALTFCGPGGSDQGRCAPMFPA